MNRSTIAIIAAVAVMVALAAKFEERDARGYFERAENFAFRGRFSEAIADYTRAIELAPDFFEAYRKRAVAHMNLTDYDLAIADQNAAIRHDPTHARAITIAGFPTIFSNAGRRPAETCTSPAPSAWTRRAFRCG